MSEEQFARVMLVDDEEDFLESLSKRLEIRGLTVTSVTRGKQAVDLAHDKQFDAIVLDLSMPGMDGLETLRKIKRDDPDAEIIMLTGHGSVKSGIEAMKLGAGDFLEKPVQLQDLLEKINEAKKKRVLVLQKESKEEIESILHSKAW